MKNLALAILEDVKEVAFAILHFIAMCTAITFIGIKTLELLKII